MTNWRDLNVIRDGHSKKLGRIIDDAARGIDSISELKLNADGSIRDWPNAFVYADGESADWTTPHCDVDWSGFEAAVVLANSQFTRD